MIVGRSRGEPSCWTRMPGENSENGCSRKCDSHPCTIPRGRRVEERGMPKCESTHPGEVRAARRALLDLLPAPALLLAACTAPPRLQNVRVEGGGFRLAESGRRFVPWGFNYDHDEAGRLLEDYWEAEWPKVVEDFHEMKELGANTVRIRLQLARFLPEVRQEDEDPRRARGEWDPPWLHARPPRGPPAGPGPRSEAAFAGGTRIQYDEGCEPGHPEEEVDLDGVLGSQDS